MVRRAADKRLCSVELHAPSQMRGADMFALFAVLAFDVKSEQNVVESGVFSLRYGFYAAELRLDLRKCGMAPIGRYAKVFKSRVIRTEKERKSNQSSHAGGRIGLGFPEIFGFLTPSGEIATSRHSVVNATIIETDMIEVECAVVQRHGEYWRLYGIGSVDSILSGQILGDEKLCDIVYEGDRCEIRASVFVDLADLWVKVDAPYQPDVLAAANRDAVCAALVAKDLRPQRTGGETSRIGNNLLLATAQIRVERPSTIDGEGPLRSGGT